MSNKPQPGAGDVVVMFEGKEVKLKPTLRALQGVSRRSGGVSGAINKLSEVDFDTVCYVLALGMDLTEKGAEGFEDRVFNEGVYKLVAPLVKYVTILANGGRPLDDSEDGKSTANPTE